MVTTTTTTTNLNGKLSSSLSAEDDVLGQITKEVSKVLCQSYLPVDINQSKNFI